MFEDITVDNGHGPFPMQVSRDMIPGYMLQWVESADFRGISGVVMCYYFVTYGNHWPTKVVSSRAVVDFVKKKPHLKLNLSETGIWFEKSEWVPQEGVPEGWVFCLNDFHPDDPRYNGCCQFRVDV